MPAVRIAAGLVLGLALALSPRPAAADGPLPPPPPRPPDVVLRHVDAPQLDVAPHSPRRVVLLVGGFASGWADPLFGELETRMKAAGYDVRRFGADARFAYDTTGAVADNARSLREQLHALGAEYDEVDIVAHSMGGVVTDVALADGTGRADHVTTYVALASPHSGSSVALIGQIALALAGEARPEMIELFARSIPLPAVRDMDSSAAHDLALASARPRADGIVRLDLREATDLTVGRGDAFARGAASLTFASGAVDGHGAILSDPSALDLVQRTIADRRVSMDARTLALAAAGAVEADVIDRWRTAGLACLLFFGCTAGVGLRLHRSARSALAPVLRPVTDAIWRRWR